MFRYSRKKVWKIHRKALPLWVTPKLIVLCSKSPVSTRLKVYCSYHCSCIPSVHNSRSESQVYSVLGGDSAFPNLNFVTWTNFNFSGFLKVDYSTLVYKLLLISSTDLLFKFIMPRERKIHLDSFCYFCGELILKAKRKLPSLLLKTAYHFHFDSKVGDKDKDWTPKFCCRQ